MSYTQEQVELELAVLNSRKEQLRILNAWFISFGEIENIEVWEAEADRSITIEYKGIEMVAYKGWAQTSDGEYEIWDFTMPGISDGESVTVNTYEDSSEKERTTYLLRVLEERTAEFRGATKKG